MKLGLTIKVLVFYTHHFMCGHHKSKSYEMGHFGRSNVVHGGRDVLVVSLTAGSWLLLWPGALPIASQTEVTSDDVLLTGVCERDFPLWEDSAFHFLAFFQPDLGTELDNWGQSASGHI